MQRQNPKFPRPLCGAGGDGAAFRGVVGDDYAPEPADGSGNLLTGRISCMVAEKMAAVQMATGAFVRRKGQAAILAPFIGCARANAKRLRRKV